MGNNHKSMNIVHVYVLIIIHKDEIYRFQDRYLWYALSDENISFLILLSFSRLTFTQITKQVKSYLLNIGIYIASRNSSGGTKKKSNGSDGTELHMAFGYMR